MAVSANTVYQRVLALANKEQRGYITPQEFNLFANQAQLEIIEQYFYDINQFSRLHGNDTDYSDMLDLLNDKLSVFKVNVTSISLIQNKTTLPADMFKMGQVISNNYELDQVEPTTINLMMSSKLLKLSAMNSVYTLQGNEIEIHGTAENVSYTYIRKPNTVSCGYVVVNEKAMYNPGNTNDFELHALEETELVYKILTLAGIALKRPDVSSTAAALQQTKIQQEKI